MPIYTSGTTGGWITMPGLQNVGTGTLYYSATPTTTAAWTNTQVMDYMGVNWPATMWQIQWETERQLLYGTSNPPTPLPDPEPECEQTPAEIQRIMDRLHAETAERIHRRQQEAAERRERQAAANGRARILLKSVLTPEQWASYLDTESFHVRGSDGYLYRIEHGTNGNIHKLDHEGNDRIRYCAHPDIWAADRDDSLPRGELPTADVLVGQVLALVADAPSLLSVANIHAQWDAEGLRLWDDTRVAQEFDP